MCIPKKKRYISRHKLVLLMKVHKSDYIKYSRFIVRKLHRSTCYGTGSMYEENVVAGLPDNRIAKKVLEALVKQNICGKKKKEPNASELVRTRSQVTGWKYYLNMDRYDKIKEIIKEKGSTSIIPILLML